jgi:hypothetical protein
MPMLARPQGARFAGRLDLCGHSNFKSGPLDANARINGRKTGVLGPEGSLLDSHRDSHHHGQ